MENIKKWLSLFAAGMISFSNPVFAVTLTPTPGSLSASSDATIEVSESNITDLNNGENNESNTSVVIGTVVETGNGEKVESADNLANIFKFKSNDFKINKRWNVDDLKYNYQMADGDNTSEISFALQNRSQNAQNVKLELTLDSNLKLKTNIYISEFLELWINDLDQRPSGTDGNYSTTVSMEGQGEIKKFKIKIHLDKLNLDEIIKNISGSTQLVNLFNLKLTLQTSSSSSG